jgi:hypothetical protein
VLLLVPTLLPGGMNKTFASAAKKLAVPVDSVRNGCHSLCHLISQCARMNLGGGCTATHSRVSDWFSSSSSSSSKRAWVLPGVRLVTWTTAVINRVRTCLQMTLAWIQA